jgi:hypothetical protein
VAHETTPDETHRAVVAARAATARSHRPETAIAAGYMPTDECVDLPGVGGMGYHNINYGLRFDGTDYGAPEVLIYADQPGGKRKLVALEYIVLDADQDPSTVERPVWAGEHYHHLKGDGVHMPYHYPLHVWAVQTPVPLAIRTHACARHARYRYRRAALTAQPVPQPRSCDRLRWEGLCNARVPRSRTPDMAEMGVTCGLADRGDARPRRRCARRPGGGGGHLALAVAGNPLGRAGVPDDGRGSRRTGGDAVVVRSDARTAAGQRRRVRGVRR